MVYHSKRDYLNCFTVTFLAVVAFFNPTTVTTLKVLAVLAAISVFFVAMTTYTATIEKDSIQYVRNFFSITISQRSIPVESIEKIVKIKFTLKLHQKSGKNIHFAMYSPEFISAMEAFCAQHAIPIDCKEKKKTASVTKNN